jgi:sugar phosphate isomerase/epimerase
MKTQSVAGSSWAVSANWLAYSASLKSHEILSGAALCAAHLEADGIQAVELPIAHMDAEILDLDDTFWLRLAEPFFERNILIASVHGPIFPMNPGSMVEAESKLIRYAEVATLLRSSALVVHPVCHASLHVCRTATKALALDSHWARITSEALEDSPTTLAIENVPHNSWAYLRRLFERLPENVGMCFDTGHYQVRPEMPLESALEHFEGRIACWHLSDNDGFCDAHLPPGEGNFEWSVWSKFSRTSLAPRIIELSLPSLSENSEAETVSRKQCLDAWQSTHKLLNNGAN